MAVEPAERTWSSLEVAVLFHSIEFVTVESAAYTPPPNAAVQP